jgi:hypothetical protein
LNRVLHWSLDDRMLSCDTRGHIFSANFGTETVMTASFALIVQVPSRPNGFKSGVFSGRSVDWSTSNVTSFGTFREPVI